MLMRAPRAPQELFALGFEAFAREADITMSWLEGALLLERDVNYSVDAAAVLHTFDALAAPLRDIGIERMSPAEQGARLAAHLGVGEGFSGNTEKYYDLRNSQISHVLASRRGLPITLSLVYCEVARRLGIHAYGVGLPGHFLIRVESTPFRLGAATALARTTRAGLDAGVVPVLFDPFHGGETIGMTELQDLVRRADDNILTAEMLQPMGVRGILARTLQNMRNVYATSSRSAEELLTLVRLGSLYPASTRILDERARLAEKLGAVGVARSDYHHLRDLLESPEDIAQVDKKLQNLKAPIAN
jgi:regulator of sirC expression with transglutaminase-like and TPR domain